MTANMIDLPFRNMNNKTKVKRVYFFTLAGTIIWLGAIFLAPYFKGHSSGLNAFLYAIFSPICHQIPSRCFFLYGNPLAVCARCVGIYSGFLAGLGLYPLLRDFSSLELPKIKTFCLLSLPVIIDTAGNFFSLWTTSGWIRFFFGFMWGIILPFYFIVGISDLYISFKKK